jgi:hypothetical protein
MRLFAEIVKNLWMSRSVNTQGSTEDVDRGPSGQTGNSTIVFRSAGLPVAARVTLERIMIMDQTWLE